MTYELFSCTKGSLHNNKYVIEQILSGNKFQQWLNSYEGRYYLNFERNSDKKIIVFEKIIHPTIIQKGGEYKVEKILAKINDSNVFKVKVLFDTVVDLKEKDILSRKENGEIVEDFSVDSINNNGIILEKISLSENPIHWEISNIEKKTLVREEISAYTGYLE
jgi:hypothetical protein